MVDVRDSVAAHFEMADLMVDDELTMVIASDVPCQTAEHFAAWDPAAVLELVAGARDIVADHYPTREHSETGNAYCHGCERQPGDCPSLRATARMLGVEVTPDV